MGLKGIVNLLVSNQHGTFADIPFVVDPGANVTAMPVALAGRHQLVIPAKRVPLNIRSSGGRVQRIVRPGWIRVKVPGIPGNPFLWPCHFVESTDAWREALLGLSGVLDDLLIHFDGAYSLDAPYGQVVLEKRPVR